MGSVVLPQSMLSETEHQLDQGAQPNESVKQPGLHYDGLDEKGKVKHRIIPKYEKWNYAGTEELVETKAGQISKGSFDTVDDYFTEHCKPLIPCLKELHGVVFPEGRRWFTEHRGLYSDMKRILQEARNNLKS